MLVELITQFCIENCEGVTAEKFNCEICKKGFCGEEFVIKHIKNKHDDLIQDVICSKYFRRQAREAYL
jgi:hypothetical protein